MNRHLNADDHRSDFEKSLAERVNYPSFGWPELDEYLLYAQGWPYLFYGEPFHGKSTFAFNALVNLSKKYGKKHFVFSPETDASVAAILKELARIYLGKDVDSYRRDGTKNPYEPTQAEKEGAWQFLREHFVCVDKTTFVELGVVKDHLEDLTLQHVYALADIYERDGGWKFSTITVDTFKEIEQSENLAQCVKEYSIQMREDGKKNNRSTVMINHTQVTPIYDKSSGSMRTPLPTPMNMSGGQNWYKLGFNVVLIFRPNPDYYEGAKDNETWVIVQKAKPRKVGTTGLVKLFFDGRTGHYSADDVTSMRATYSAETLPDEKDEYDFGNANREIDF